MSSRALDALRQAPASRARLWSLRRNRSASLAIAVVAGSVAGAWGLTRVLSGEERVPTVASVRYGQIAFVSHQERRDAIYLVRTDATDLHRLSTGLAGDDSGPDWSPDGRAIAFTNTRAESADIYTIAPDGSGLRRLTDNLHADYGPDWSPDGSAIAFTRVLFGDDVEEPRLYVMAPDGSAQRELPTGRGNAYDAAWSTDGTRIAFVSDRTGDDEIYVLDLTSSEVSRLTADPASADVSPAWSPDDTRIAFQVDSPSEAFVVLMTADGTRLTTLSAGAGWSDFDPAWSPDGQRLAYSSTQYGRAEILVMGADGSGPQRITRMQGHNRNPDWQPVVPGDPVPGRTMGASSAGP